MKDLAADLYKRVDIIGIGTFTIGLFIYMRIGGYPLEIYDEAVYATAAKHAVKDGFWLIPRSHYASLDTLTPFLEKPPLAIWLMAVSMTIFGISEFAARFPAALSTVLIGGIIYSHSKREFDAATGAVAGLIFYSIPYLYLGRNAGRRAATDMVFTLFVLIAVLSAWHVARHNDSKFIYGIGLGGAGALLSKGFATGLAGLILLPLLIYWRRFWNKKTALTAIVSISPVVAWTSYSYSIFGDEFINQIFIEQVIRRVGADPTPGTLLPFMSYEYFQTHLFFVDPWHFFFITALFLFSAKVWRTPKWSVTITHLGFLFWWVICIFLFFTYTGNHAAYMIPTYPAVAIVSAWAIRKASTGDTIAQVGLTVAVGAALLLSPRATYFSLLVDFYSNQRMGPMVAPISGYRFAVGVLLIPIGVVVATKYERFPDVSSRIISSKPSDERVLRQLMVVVITVGVILAFVGMPPSLAGVGHADDEVRILKQSDTMAGLESVFVTKAADDTPTKLLMGFYLSNPELIEQEKISTLPPGSVVIITPSQISQIKCGFEVIGQTNHWRGSSYEFISIQLGSGSC